ncbi:MAG: alpha/beta hydrolase [Acidimicrobiales bacterium]
MGQDKYLNSDLDDDVASLLSAAAAANVPSLSDGTPAQARKNYARAPKPVGDELERVEDAHIPGPAGDIPVRLYAATAATTSATAPGLPVMAFFHGGGWVLSDIDGHDSLARRLALRTGALVVSVEYRLAPEHPFPTPHDDCWAVTTWLADNAAQLGGDPGRLSVAGDSAGGNLAAGVALRARDEGLALRSQLLIYPCIDDRQTRPSMTENAEGYFLSAKDMAWFWDHFVPAEHRDNPYAVPARAEDLTRLAPAHIQTAAFDPLRDEGEEWAERLQAAGVDTSFTRFDGVVHGFVARWEQMSGALAAHDEFETVVAPLL